MTFVALTAAVSLVAACGSDDDTGAADTDAVPSETDAAPIETDAAPVDTEADDMADDDMADDIDRSDWPDSIVMGAVPSEESTALQESYEKLLEVLELDLGIEVEFFQATDYAGIIEGQVAGRVDLAQYGPFSYVIAKNAGADIAPVGALVDDPEEQPGYQSYGITKSDNDEINELADFAGRSVCFVDPGSTSGFLYPSAGLIAEGIDPESGVSAVFAGGHDASVISVNNGDCEAGFAFDAMVDNVLIESGDISEGDIKTVWESEVIAGSPIAINLELPASLIAEINRIVLEESNTDRLIERGICTDVESCGLTDENAWGWVVVDDSFYDGVREVCVQTQAAQCES
ncbi:MAG: phosphate/phosphite/phosphonate ABC transporter substrate-binding protein [Ilumatobacteraceae bacterium]